MLEHELPSENLVLVEVNTLADLQRLRVKLTAHNILHVCFYEPDLNNELTAIAVAPEGWRLLSSLPLAFRART